MRIAEFSLDDIESVFQRLGLPPHLTLVLIGVVVGLVVLSQAADGIRLIASSSGALVRAIRGLPVHGEARERAGDRRLFAEYVAGEIANLNAQEQWSDRRYAELEAEVETEADDGIRPLLRFVGRP